LLSRISRRRLAGDFAGARVWHIDRPPGTLGRELIALLADETASTAAIKAGCCGTPHWRCSSALDFHRDDEFVGFVIKFVGMTGKSTRDGI
jgi:hypothetical protein